MIDELSSRRSRFQPGIPICLANGQEWTFPAPAADSEFAVESAEAEYVGLIHVVQEAEDQSERRLVDGTQSGRSWLACKRLPRRASRWYDARATTVSRFLRP